MFDRVQLYEWEVLANEQVFKVVDPGAFNRDVKKARLFRDEELKAVLEMSGSIVTVPVPRSSSGVPGTAVQEPPLVQLENSKYTATVKWAVPLGQFHSAHFVTGESRIEQRAHPSSVVLSSIYNSATPESLTEWIINLPKDYVWSHSTYRELSAEYVCSMDGSVDRLSNLGNRGSTRDCCRLRLVDHPELKVYVGFVDKMSADPGWKAGFIRYVGEDVGSLTDELRGAVRDCLSFVFGKPLASLGYSVYAHNGQLLKAVVKQPYLPSGLRSLAEPSLAPTLLSSDGSNSMSGEVMQRIFGSLFANYDRLHLRHIFGLYFHAQTQPLDTQVGALAATVEAIRQAFFKATESEKAGLLPKPQWREVHSLLQRALQQITDSESFARYRDALGIVENKLGQLNQCPSSIATQRFFEKTRLKLSKLEQDALKGRNRPAHGVRYDPGDYPEVMHQGRTLQTLCSRMVLRATGASDTYIDYSSAGLPVRDIREGCQGKRI